MSNKFYIILKLKILSAKKIRNKLLNQPIKILKNEILHI